MRTQTRSGFTIIEVMLFLAITGALTVAILVGSGAAINRQRYRDSVNTFKGLIQEQYGQVANVVNGEVKNPPCSRFDDLLDIPEGVNDQARGTSDCLVVGRFIVVEPEKVTTYNLIGQPPSEDEGDSDSEILTTYAFAVQEPAEEHRISWNAQIVEPGAGEAGSTTSIAIVRSPRSGSILTYIQDGDQRSSIREMINDGNMNKQKDFCVDPDRGGRRGPLGGPGYLAVRINAGASNQSAIEIPLESEGVCEG